MKPLILITILVAFASLVRADIKPAYMLVCLDARDRDIPESDPRVSRYQKAIDALEKSFKISEKMISDQTWVVVESLRKQGVKTSAIEIMEGVVGMKEAEKLGVSYAEIVATLMTLMQPKPVK